MRTTLMLLVVCLGCGRLLAQPSDLVDWPLASMTNHVMSDYVSLPKPTPTRRILPEDIEQDSIQVFRLTTNSFVVPENFDNVQMLRPLTNGFVVRFSYTLNGAKKMLAFQREHAGHDVLIQVGSFERQYTTSPQNAKPAGWTEQGYLKHRGDKFIGVSQDDARKIVDGLKKK